MIREDKYRHALYALHQIFVRARFMAYTEETYKDIGIIMDYAERMPGFLASDEDETEQFRQYLEVIIERFPQLTYIIQRFDSDSVPDKW